MYIAILGRQPALGIAELERLSPKIKEVSWFSNNTALFQQTEDFSIERLGGTQKAGVVTITLPRGDWRAISQKIVQYYTKAWLQYDGKITLGLSAYGFHNVSPRDVQKTGLILKSKLKESSASLRLIPNTDAALSSATSHHNKLGLSPNKVELLIVQASNGRVIVAESTGAQNITALAARDQGRPKRDAFVGMLPPKLAQMMINLTGTTEGRLLDPFCGTGVILQEAALMRRPVYGTDLADKMIDYTKANLDWLAQKYHLTLDAVLEQGDATTATWQSPIATIAAETYLGQPFSAPPSASKLTEVRGNCNHIISSFLKNAAVQLPKGTPLCIAVPAWRDANGGFTHLPLIGQLKELGYKQIEFTTISTNQLLYYREDQIVARELLVLERA